MQITGILRNNRSVLTPNGFENRVNAIANLLPDGNVAIHEISRGVIRVHNVTLRQIAENLATLLGHGNGGIGMPNGNKLSPVLHSPTKGKKEPDVPRV